MEALHHHRSAIDCSNIGLAHWNSGEGLGAIQFFFSAYRYSLKSLSFSNGNSVGGEETANFSVNEAMESSLRTIGEKQEFPNKVFHSGIRVPLSPDVFNNPSNANKSMVLHAVVFNLAVVHHLVAKWGNIDIHSELQEKFHRTAVEFYQMGLQLQQEQVSGCGMYTIAIMNNLAHLYSTLGDEEKSAFYFSEMLIRIAALEEAFMGDYDDHASRLQEIVASAAPAA
ncbi:MAG: hypothetical protein SGBAC_008399 [Bacillariaceae sp.]